jgi:hypothetical protein
MISREFGSNGRIKHKTSGRVDMNWQGEPVVGYLRISRKGSVAFGLFSERMY